MEKNEPDHLLNFILKEFHFFYTKKKIILIFFFVGLLFGYTMYILKSNNLQKQYQTIFYANSNLIHNELLFEMINILNGSEVKPRAKKMNISIKSSASIIDIKATLQKLPEIKSDLSNKSNIYFCINYKNKYILKELIEGIKYYVKTNEYLKDRLKDYTIKQSEKKQLNLEINREIIKSNKIKENNPILSQYLHITATDLYKIKIKIEDEIIAPNAFSIIMCSDAMDKTEKPNFWLNIGSYSLLFGFSSMLLLNFIRFIKKMNSMS